MICVECGQPVNDVHHQYRGGVTRLTRCGYCKQVADKYVEHELVIIFLDLVLHKPQAYRHVIFNRMEYCDKGLPMGDLQLAFYIILMEAYSRMRSSNSLAWAEFSHPDHWQGYAPSLQAWEQFGMLLAICALQLVLYCCASVSAAWFIFHHRYPIVRYNYLVKCIILSNFGRCFFVLMMIWDYDNPAAFQAIVDLFVFTSNFVAVRVWTGSGIPSALAISMVGWIARVAANGLVQSLLTFAPMDGMLSRPEQVETVAMEPIADDITGIDF